jgi:mono/diheme cytochrome c family protein
MTGGRAVQAFAVVGAVVGALAILGASAALGQVARPSTGGAASNGERLAQRHCGGCHAVAGGPSPLADAPPFSQLFSRYRPGHLDEVLAEGMLAPRQRLEEGSPMHHPRMPMVEMDDDEAADLKAYLLSLDPRDKTEPSSCQRNGRCKGGERP